MTAGEFDRVADGEVRRCVEHQVSAGADILVDGEQRRDNFYSFVTDKLDGTKLMSLAEMLDTVEDKSGFEEMLDTLSIREGWEEPLDRYAIDTALLTHTAPLAVMLEQRPDWEEVYRDDEAVVFVRRSG